MNTPKSSNYNAKQVTSCHRVPYLGTVLIFPVAADVAGRRAAGGDLWPSGIRGQPVVGEGG
jgi:hypothetical protein